MDNEIKAKLIKEIETLYPSPQKAQRELFKLNLRRCSSCKEVKELDFFGIHSKTCYRRTCKSCESNIAKKKWHEKRANQTLDEAIQYKFYQAKYRSQSKQRDFCLSIEDVKKQWEKQNGLCYYTGVPMEIKTKNPNHFSIDRIDSSKGYAPENIVLCTHIINLMKNDFSTEIFVEYCALVVNNWHTRPF